MTDTGVKEVGVPTFESLHKRAERGVGGLGARQPVKESVNQSVNQSTRQLTNQSTSEPSSQPDRQRVNQGGHQAIHTNNKSVTHDTRQSHRQLTK